MSENSETRRKIKDIAKASNIIHIEVTYCGSGDEGYVNEADYTYGESEKEKSLFVENKPKIVKSKVSEDELDQLIEELIMEELAAPGFETNQGGGGSVVIDVTAGKINHSTYINMAVDQDSEEHDL